MMVNLSDEVKDQLAEAAYLTNKAYQAVRRGREAESNEKTNVYTGDNTFKASSAGRLIATEIACMQPILRFLQLLCENHNADLQVTQLPSILSYNNLKDFVSCFQIFNRDCMFKGSDVR